MGKKELTPRQGKCLRYVVNRTMADSDRVSHAGVPVEYATLVTKIDWSDLPHSILSAKATLGQLETLELVRKEGKGYLATEAGITLIAQANVDKLWNT